MLTATAPNWQAQLAADPAHERWLDLTLEQDLKAFDDWLSTPEGQKWLDAELAIDEERQGRSEWEGW